MGLLYNKKYIIIILCLLVSSVCIAQTDEGVISNKRGSVCIYLF